MKRKLFIPLALTILSALNPQLSTFAQGTAFTYQGQLTDNGSQASGNYDIQFYLRDAVTAGNPVGTTNTVVPVAASNGLFTVTLDFGPRIFTGASLWLEIGVRTNGSAGVYTTLTPRQPLTPAPYAINAGSVAGLRSQANATSPNLIGGFSGNTVSTGVVGATIGGGGEVGQTNRVSGDYGVVAGGFGNVASSNSAAIGGGSGNTASGNHATVAGGLANVASGDYSFIGGGLSNDLGTGSFIVAGQGNTCDASWSGIGGGLNNAIRLGADYSLIGDGRGNINGGAYAVIGGGESNQVTAPFGGYSVIGGGTGNQVNGGTATISGGSGNTAGGNSSTIGGGEANQIQGGASLGSTIGGGYANVIQNQAQWATVSGGYSNTIQSSASYGAIGGGSYNFATGGGAFIGGGGNGSVSSGNRGITNNLAAGFESVISGGFVNTASGRYSVVPGGDENVAAGDNRFAGGHRAKATHQGSFVWADSTDADFGDAAANEFFVRASGGVFLEQGFDKFITINSAGDVELVTGPGGTGLVLLPTGEADLYSSPGGGVYVAAGGSGWNALSDRNSKENLVSVDPRQVLDRLAAVPISTWNYKTQSKSIRHLGPMAQDFHSAFDVGEDEKHINNLDEEGVALAAIQGLNQKLEETQLAVRAKDGEIQTLKQQNDSLVTRLNELEATVKQLAAQK